MKWLVYVFLILPVFMYNFQKINKGIKNSQMAVAHDTIPPDCVFEPARGAVVCCDVLYNIIIIVSVH